jgi:hypothetical protein
MARIRRIVVVSATGVRELARAPKKRVPRWARPAEKATRRVLAARRVRLETLERLHERSNAKKRNGWLRDLVKNRAAARRKALRILLRR